MTPGSFDPVTAREIVGDQEARRIEAKARADAEAQTFDPPGAVGSTYQAQMQAQMRHVVYAQQYEKRLTRIKRKALAPEITRA